ncbi:hypothetical protein V7157_18895 [Neobacillus drentensis]|uniref:hypothetical protein n=1 Tax=Neobacillus drentensis TaxID=220684 RepID=UPI003001768D
MVHRGRWSQTNGWAQRHHSSKTFFASIKIDGLSHFHSLWCSADFALHGWLTGTSNHKSIKCNPDPTRVTGDAVLGCYTSTLSNWSVAQEIERLVQINSVQDKEEEYEFHKEDCIAEEFTQFNKPDGFYKQGKSRLGMQRFQCKVCKKKTALTPSRDNSITYNQKRSDIHHLFAKLLLSRTPVTRACEILEIGR